MSAVAPMFFCLMTGCVSMGGFTPPWKKADAPKVDGPKDSITLTGARGLERDPVDPGLRQELDAAKRLFDEKKYAEAEPIFHKLVRANSDPNWWEFGWLGTEGSSATTQEKSKPKSSGRGKSVNPVAEASTFYEAECQRLQKNYRTAANTYSKLLVDFPRSQYTPGTCKGLFEIADYWLEPTRRQMDDYHDQAKAKRWLVMPAMYFHFSNDMPALDAEGHAVTILNTVRVHDIRGELGRKSLLYLGTIHFFRHDYKEADFYFTRLYEEYPNSEHAAKAIKQSVICKQLVTGGSVYDLRGVAKSKELLLTSMGAYPELARDEEWVRTQLTSINVQQADRDFRIAEFYQRTGHPGSAYFYYELVCRRYPGSEYATKAAERKSELKARVEKEQQAERVPPASPDVSDPAVQTPTPIQAPRRFLPMLPSGR